MADELVKSYIDANVLIYFAEAHEEFGAAVKSLFEAAQASRLILVASEFALAEVQVMPLRAGRMDLVATYDQLMVTRRGLEIRSVDRLVLFEAAKLRAQTGMKTPDAVHVATALLAGCSIFITQDSRIISPQNIDIVRVSDVPQLLQQIGS